MTPKRMPRSERREQILRAATRAFAQSGFTATGLDDVAAEAGVTRVLLYRHFDSKADLYRAVLERVRERLVETVGKTYDEGSIPALVKAAAEEPDGFRLLFRHAAREPEFRDMVDLLHDGSVEIAHEHLVQVIPDGPWTLWAARLLPAVTIEAVIAWLDAGQPDPDRAAERVAAIVGAVIDACEPGGAPTG